MDAHTKSAAYLFKFPDSVLEGGYANHASRRAPGQREILGFPFRLTPATVAPGPNLSGRYSVSSALPYIAFQRAKGVRKVFSEGVSLEHLLSSETCSSKSSAAFFGVYRTHTRAAKNRRVQASQT